MGRSLTGSLFARYLLKKSRHYCPKGSPFQAAHAAPLKSVVIMENKDFFAHPTAVIDEGCTIGKGTKIWHFSHIMPNCTIGERCNMGQNVVISPEVVLGSNVKIQNNVSVYTGVICEDDVFLGPSMVFTNVINPRSAVNQKGGL